jgi:DNA/RNA endonuclease YhcR with UshA esterase domain
MPEKSIVPDYPKETLCPSCGKFIGAYARCPYCGTKAEHRMSIRFFRFFAIAMSLGGVFVIWLVAYGVNAPLVKVDEIGPTYNFGIVRVEGKVDRTSIPPWGGLDFSVDDGTGVIRVRAYQDMAKKIIDAGRFPSEGDVVSVEGTLRLSGASRLPMMVVNVPEKIRVISSAPEAPSVSISSLSRDKLNERIRVEGKFTGVRTFEKGTALTLDDGTGTLEIVVWNSDRSRLGAKEKLLSENSLVSIQGKLGEYRDKLQIVLKSPKDIKEIEGISEPQTRVSSPPAQEAPAVTIASLNKNQLGRQVHLEGKFTEIRKFSKGTAFTLDDGTGTIEIIVWDSDRSALGDKEKLLTQGKRISIKGKLSEYRDKLQIILNSAKNIEEL